MAFFGILLMYAMLIAVLAWIFFTILFLIIGLVTRKKHPKASDIFLFFCAFNLLIPSFFAILIKIDLLYLKTTVETRDGTAVIEEEWIKKYDKYLEKNDLQKLNDLLDQHPEMIYYYRNGHDNHEGGRQFLLDYGVHNLNTEIMQIAVNHGAVFDDPLRYDHLSFDSSFEVFLFELDKNVYINGNVDDKMFEVIEFMLNHGAAVQYKNSGHFKFDNFYDHMAWWVSKDGAVTDKEQQLLELIAGHMENSGSD